MEEPDVVIDLTEEEYEELSESSNKSKLVIFPNPYYSLASRNNKKYGGHITVFIPPNKNPENDRITSHVPIKNIQHKITSDEPVKKINEKFCDVVLFLKASEEENPISTMQRNASLNNKKIKWTYKKNDQNVRICSLHFNDRIIANVPTVSGMDMKYAREAAAQAAIEKLQQSCYTIKVKSQVFSEAKVDRSTLASSTEEPKPVEPSKSVELAKPAEPPKSNLEKELGPNIGLKLMKLMGWGGGGLGKNQQGIEEPIQPPTQIRREGLGLIVKKNKPPDKPNCKKEAKRLAKKEAKKEVKKQISKKAAKKIARVSFKSQVRTCVTNWLESNSSEDLVFSSEFSQMERKVMHKVAEQLALKSESYGSNDNRYIVISKKPSPRQIVEELIAAGGSSDKYELVCPGKT